jgi:hypothetical protein
VLPKLLDAFEGLVEWFTTLCTQVSMLSGGLISLVGAALDTLDLIFNLVTFGSSIGRLIERGEFPL